MRFRACCLLILSAQTGVPRGGLAFPAAGSASSLPALWTGSLKEYGLPETLSETGPTPLLTE